MILNTLHRPRYNLIGAYRDCGMGDLCSGGRYVFWRTFLKVLLAQSDGYAVIHVLQALWQITIKQDLSIRRPSTISTRIVIQEDLPYARISDKNNRKKKNLLYLKKMHIIIKINCPPKSLITYNSNNNLSL
jgi:hypothetical protein